jgi:beta-glucosidase
VLCPDGTDADPAAHDVAIVVIGERPYAEGMGDIRVREQLGAGSGPGGTVKRLPPYGETTELSRLHPEDLAVLRTVAARGIPVVGVLVSGRPLVVTQELAASAAFVATWLPGSEGQGVADVLFGDHDFQGTLSFSWPAGTNRQAAPLFPVGFGLRHGKATPAA